MAPRRWSVLALVLLATLALLAQAQNYDYAQPEENQNFQNAEEQAQGEFPGAEASENSAEGGTMGGANQDSYPATENEPFQPQTNMAEEQQQQADMEPAGDQGASGNIPAEGETTPQENEGSSTPADASTSTEGETAPPEDPTNSEASAETQSAMEDNSAGAALSPSAQATQAAAAAAYGAQYADSWKKIEGGQVGPETIIGAAIGAVLGMSLCIFCICICYIRQRNIARAQYGPHGGGQIEM